MKQLKKAIVLLLAVILVLTFAGCKEKQQKKVVQKREIPEYVLTREIGKNGDGEIYRISEYSYDKWGDVVKIEHKNGEGEVIERKEYQYNEQGLKVKRKITKVVKDSTKYRWRSGTYDREELDEQRKVRETLYLTKGETTYRYSNNNQLVYYEKRNKAGKKIDWIDFEYHDNGELKLEHFQTNLGSAKKNYYNELGQLVKQIDYGIYFGDKQLEKFFYDKKGNRIKNVEKIFNKSGDVIERDLHKYKYDKNGNQIEFINYEDGKYTGGYKSEYDEDGNRIKFMRIDKNREAEWIRKYKYDEKGDRTYYVEKTGDGEIMIESSYNYEYDKNGNLIKDDFAEYEYKNLKQKGE